MYDLSLSLFLFGTVCIGSSIYLIILSSTVNDEFITFHAKDMLSLFSEKNISIV